jgi:hypothetical protein
VQYEASNGLTVSGGQLIASVALAGGGSTLLSLHELDVRMAAGDVLTIAGSINGGAGNNISVSVNWNET